MKCVVSSRPPLLHGLAAIALAGACTAAPPAESPSPAPVAAARAAPPPPPAPASTAPRVEPGLAACGPLACKLFDTPEQAFLAVLEQQPQVLAIGEAHAQKGSEGVQSSTARFTNGFLPLLSGRATDLILELMVPNPQCKKEVKEVAKRQKPVTEPQAESNQNEFLVLARRAQELKVAPHVLRPSCADFDEITKAGDGDVAVMLAMIARLTTAMAKPLVDRNGAGSGKLVVAYGGALHNDVEPRAGREAMSFGPELKTHTGGRYVELDLIVPEFIKDSETWRALPWYEHFDPKRAPEKTTLFNPIPGSYVLIFPRSS
jgi:hypothetical protein